MNLCEKLQELKDQKIKVYYIKSGGTEGKLTEVGFDYLKLDDSIIPFNAIESIKLV